MRFVLVVVAVIVALLSGCGEPREELSPWEVRANAAISEQLNAPLRLAAGRTTVGTLLRALPTPITTLTNDIAPEWEIDHGAFAISGVDALDEIVLQTSPKVRAELAWQIIAGEVVIGTQSQLADPAVRARLRSGKRP
ncbi:MAG: hypothetical protein H0W72_13610 [Planctomycetes bacterium]|nr:hypothetical protein [Planctomycetota bacterium]